MGQIGSGKSRLWAGSDHQIISDGPDRIWKGSAMDRIGSGKDQLWTGSDPERIVYGPERIRKGSAMDRGGFHKTSHRAVDVLLLSLSLFLFFLYYLFFFVFFVVFFVGGILGPDFNGNHTGLKKYVGISWSCPLGVCTISGSGSAMYRMGS